MNTLGSTLPAASAAVELARAAGDNPDIARAQAPSGKSLASVAKNGRSRRASVAAQAAASARRPSVSRAKARPAASGWAMACHTRGAAVAGAAGRAAAAAASTSSKGASGAAQGERSDPLAFLDDPKLSVEEKLMRLLHHMNGKWEKDMKKKLDEIAGRSPSSVTSKSSGSSAKGSSFLGKIVDGAKKFFPAAGIALDALKSPVVRDLVGKIGGPVLAAGATAIGFPALAPALLKYGPDAIEAAAGALSGLDQGGSGQASGTGGSGEKASGTNGSGGGLSETETKEKFLEFQRIQDVQKEMFTMVSNYMRSNHELRMSLVGNLR